MTTIQDTIFEVIKTNYWRVWDANTTKLSNICRQLAFAEGGICWFFISPQCPTSLAAEPSKILIYLVSFFVLDALQYFLSSMIYGIAALYYESLNKKNLLKNKKSVDRKLCMNVIPFLLFISKLITLGVASFLIISLLIR